MSGVAKAFRIHGDDNVATLLDACEDGVAEVVGAGAALRLDVKEPIQPQHKVAVAAIAEGAEVVKYGAAIGIATRDIAPGDWVHLHNCRSRLDERSSTLDVYTGATTDTVYE